VAALLVIQRPELVNGVVFSSPAILRGAGVVLVHTCMLCCSVVSCVLCSVD